MDYIIKTSSLFYNCAFHVITPYLAAYISPKVVDTPDFQFKEISPTAEQRRIFNQTDGYQYFCKAFSEYYHLQNESAVEEKIKVLLEKFPNPLDLQVLLGPVLRITLGKVLQNNVIHKENLKESFLALITKCKKYLDESNHAYEFYSAERMKSVLSDLSFGKDEHEELFKPNIVQITQIILANNNTEIDSVWDLAYENYCKYLADPGICSYISEDQLKLLCFSFDFSFNGEKPPASENETPTILGVVNGKLGSSQDHWEIVNKSNSNWNQSLESIKQKATFERYHSAGLMLLSEGYKDKVREIQDTFRNKINNIITQGTEYQEEYFTLFPTSDWAGNSGLDKLSSLIASVTMAEVQLTVKSSSGLTLHFENTIGFERFLEAFCHYYQVQNATTKESRLLELKKLCTFYPLHQERVMIISPVLRGMFESVYSTALIEREHLINIHLEFGIAVEIFEDTQAEKVTSYARFIDIKPQEGSFATFSYLRRESAWHAVEPFAPEAFEFSRAHNKYSSSVAFNSQFEVTEERLQKLQKGISRYLSTGVLYVENQRHSYTSTAPSDSELRLAIRTRNTAKVIALLEQGENWRTLVTSPKLRTERVLSVNSSPKKISYLEFAACYSDRKTVSAILQRATIGSDDKLIQNAYDGACNFKRIKILPAFLSYSVKHSHQALINAVQAQNLALYQTFSERGAPVLPDLTQNAKMMQYLYNLWELGAGEPEFNRAFQELFLLTFYKQKQSLPGIKPNAFEFNADVFQVFDKAYEDNAVAWMNHFIQTMIKIKGHLNFQAEQAKAISSSIGNLLERVAIKACLAITNEDRSELEKCFKISECFVRVNGSNNIWHHAFQLDRMTFITEAYISYVYAEYGLIKGSDPALDIPFFDNANSSLMEISKEARDQFDRTLAFREERIKLGKQLDAKVDTAVDAIDKIKAIASRLKYRADNIAISLSDKLHERAVQASNVQNTLTYRTLYVGQQLLRTIPTLISHGPLRVGMSLTSLFLSNEARKRILNKAVQYSGDYAAPLIGWDRQTAERIIPTVAENILYFSDNPSYYMLSTGLSLSCYQGFKDSGYTSLEALAQCTLDSISYNLVAGCESNLVVDERFLHRLNNNLTPFIGQTATSWVALPGITFVQNAANQWNLAVNYPVVALRSYVNPEILSTVYQSLVATYPTFANIPLSSESIGSIINPGLSFIRASGTQLNEVFHSSISQLTSYLDTLSPGDVNISLNPEFKAKVAPLANALDAISTDSQWFFEQSRDIVNQTPMYQEYFLNLIEKSILSTLTDSAFKSERLHAHQMFETHCINISVAQLKNTLSEATERGDSLAIEIAQKALNNQNVLLIEAKAKEDALFKETEGCKYFETWQDKYLTLKNKEFDKMLSPSQIEVIRAEERQARSDSLLYNSDLVNHFGNEWSSAVDGIFDKNEDNFTDNTDWVGVIKGIYQDALAKFTNRDLIAEYISNEIIRRKYPLYPDVGDRTTIEAEREKHRFNVYEYKLDGFDSKKGRRRDRCDVRLYNYIESAIGNTPEKQHVHRWNRMYTHFEQKFWKPLANEFAYVFTLGNWHPYKRYPVGFERGGGSGGTIFINFNQNIGGGGFKIHTSSGGTQFTIYDSSRKSQSEFTLPEFKKNIEVIAGPKNIARGAQPLVLPSAQMETAPSRSASDNPAMSLDNPIIQSILEAQYNDVFESGHTETTKTSPKNTQLKIAKPQTQSSVQKTPASAPPSLAQPQVVTPSNNAPQATGSSNDSSWMQMWIRSIRGEKSPAVTQWKQQNVARTPNLSAFYSGVAQSTLPVNELPGLTAEAGIEFLVEAVQQIHSAIEFVHQEGERALKGEALQSVQAIQVLGVFIGEESARVALGENTETARFAKELVAGFGQMSEQERFKAVTKIAFSFRAPIVGGQVLKNIAASAKTAANATGALPKITPRYNLRQSTVAQSPIGKNNIVAIEASKSLAAPAAVSAGVTIPMAKSIQQGGKALANEAYTPHYNLRPRTANQNLSSSMARYTSNESSSFLPQRKLPEGTPSYLNYQRQTGGKNLTGSTSDLTVREALAQEAKALEMYNQIRANSFDVAKIAKNTGIKAHQIERIKNHLFVNKHQLSGKIERFDPDLSTAQAWKRLEQGSHSADDLQLLRHEHFEARFEGIFRTDYVTAHDATNRSGRFSGQSEFERNKYISDPKNDHRFIQAGEEHDLTYSVRKNI